MPLCCEWENPLKRTKKASKVKAKSSPSIEWSDAIVRELMTLRYETYAERFGKAKNSAAIGACWVLLTTDLRDSVSIAISTEQCKNKLKWLKKKWTEYNADVRATGNKESGVAEPPGLDLMEAFWVGSSGMNGQTLADSEIDGAPLLSEDECASDEETRRQSPRNQRSKKRKPMGDSFEIDMQSIADGFQAMAAAMQPAPATGESAVAEWLEDRFNLLLQHQYEQMEQMRIQNQNLAALVAALTDKR
ncbi:hypothetical protein PHMEG_00020956 [Phytophthora megakarya]|uniref:Myb/SANT-like DNA-binding domain-containing protein n=1 Tax=Phytophthora megakarya TaxID=4795 RepID=A0A225VMW1_9STRA|nr:hypothetical protein PHMEG_00020956 [Phytophthora megakarya]